MGYLESMFTKNIWINYFTVFKPFGNWCCTFDFKEFSLIAFVIKDIYKKIKTPSESVYILKRLLINKWNIKNKFLLNSFQD